MKTKFTFLLFALFGLFSNQSHAQAYQVPNGSFEIWDSINGLPLNPVGWASYESIFGTQLGLTTQDAGIIGNYSIKLTSDSIVIAPSYGVVAAVVSLGSGTTVAGAPSFHGEPFAYRPDSFFFAFKYSSPGTDTPYVFVYMSKEDTSAVMELEALLPDSSEWVLANIALDGYYLNGKTPDSLQILFSPSYGHPVQHSTLNVDGVYFGYKVLPAAIQEMADKLELSVYPNPASNVINIKTAEDVSGYRMIITDLSGKLVDIATLTGIRSTIDVSRYASGTYIYRIADTQGNIFRQDKFIVVK